ncbi:MAG: hypothetical protein K2Q18_17810 [Bdellovibrionales bacterium]|nr:hypothetical protein [Bdellovibrionales bacterium]
MKNLLKISLFLLVLGTNQIASASNLDFKSPHLAKAVEIFKAYSPELAATGKVEVNYCGTYGAIVSLQKYDAQEFAKNFVFQPTYLVIKNTVDFTALELQDEQIEKLSHELGLLNEYQKLSLGNALSFDLRGGVAHVWFTASVAMWDLTTNEYLVFGGTTWQDDCD